MSTDHEWIHFLASHPELTGAEFTRDELLEALDRALTEATYLARIRYDGQGLTDERLPLGAAISADVASQLCPLPAKGLVLRVARELGALADEGRIVRLRPPKWRGIPLAWTRSGTELAPHIARWYGAESSHAR